MANLPPKPRIKEGDVFPAVNVGLLKDNQVTTVNTAELFKGKKVLVFCFGF
jgi:peroxiredoxin